jgi:acylphosphatase
MFVEHRAERLGLVGYVRNDANDHRRLEVVAEGNRSSLEALLRDLQKGPPGARVETVQTAWEAGQGTFRYFKVEYDY